MTKYADLPKKRCAPKKLKGDERVRLSSPTRFWAHPSYSSSPQRFKTWAQEVMQILDKPTVAVCVFIFGVVIIVVASKQLKLTFDLLEYYWGGGRPQDGFIGNFMVIFVFMFVWLDTVLLQWIKALTLTLYAYLNRQYHQFKEALEKVQEANDLEALERRKLMRKRKASTDRRQSL